MAFDFKTYERDVRAACPEHADKLMALARDGIFDEATVLAIAKLGAAGVRSLLASATPKNDLASRLARTGCTEMRRGRVMQMRGAKQIDTDDRAVEVAKLSPRAFTVYCETIAREAREAPPNNDDADDDDRSDNLDELRKISARTGVPVDKLRKGNCPQPIGATPMDRHLMSKILDAGGGAGAADLIATGGNGAKHIHELGRQAMDLAKTPGEKARAVALTAQALAAKRG